MNIDKLKENYSALQKELSELKEKAKEYKLKITDMEFDIQDYMQDNNMTKLGFSDGSTIMLSDTKQMGGFKKDTITESLKDKFDDQKANEIADHVLKNRPFTEKKVIKYQKKKV